jgi:RimJ/RimL family protein N-acetyltransferase
MGDRLCDNEQLLTARLSLRRPTPADIDAIHHIHSNPSACAHNPSDMLVSRRDAENLCRRWDEHWRRHGFGYWVMRARESNAAIVGFCGLKAMRLDDRDVLNLFYRLDPPAWGDGLAGEAATAVVAWARAHIPRRPVVARVRPDNVASARVAVRAGLRRAEHLDSQGEDGLDWMFVTGWPEAPGPTLPAT